MRSSAAISGASHAGWTYSHSAEAAAWTAFWEEQEGDSPCLCCAPNELRDQLADHWSRFAATLKHGTKVLDIGCGSGIVGRSLVRAQPSLRVVGVDTAQVRTALSSPNVRILSGIAIEARCFRAVVSQFGYEYSDIHAAAIELARVISPNGRFSFVVHHSQSMIVLGDQMHSKALRAATGECVRRAFLGGDCAALADEFAKLQREFPDETTLCFLARGLLAHIAGTPERRQSVWNAVKEALAPDRILSGALEASCVAPTEIEAWLSPLHQAFNVDRPSILQFEGDPLAWKIEGRRKIH